ncbi:hypothetical protein ACFYRC_34305 [Streptomyces sp. NPDC005279]|uniref:hypothetical protein n=1 Tax=Streptomyces sp. NPDC005279 TaxID=3364712 RepID=UPI0036A815E4
MQKDTPEFEVLVERIRRGLEARVARARRGRGYGHADMSWEDLRSAGRVLQPLRSEDYPGVVEAALTAIRTNGRSERERNGFASHGATMTENVVRFFFEAAGEHLDTEAVARQAADYLAGRPRPLREHVLVDLSAPACGVPLFDGWELSGTPSRHEPLWRLDAPPIVYERRGAGGLHRAGFGELRRPKPAQALDGTPPGAHDLVWPLIALNLLGPSPVRAFTAYQTEPGRRLIEVGGFGRAYVPVEITAWHPDPLSAARPNSEGWVARPNSRAIDASAASGLARYAAEFGSALGALGETDRRAFARAAEHHLYLVYHHGGHQTELNGSYVAFRRTVATEILLAGSDKDHASIARKVSQRAAVLVGDDDDDRLAVQALIQAAYAARSAFAHGSQGTKTVDDTDLERVVRLIMRRWLALAGTHPGRRLAALLDDALLSATVRDSVLQTVEDHERRAGILGDTHLVSLLGSPTTNQPSGTIPTGAGSRATTRPRTTR